MLNADHIIARACCTNSEGIQTIDVPKANFAHPSDVQTALFGEMPFDFIPRRIGSNLVHIPESALAKGGVLNCPLAEIILVAWEGFQELPRPNDTFREPGEVWQYLDVCQPDCWREFFCAIVTALAFTPLGRTHIRRWKYQLQKHIDPGIWLEPAVHYD
jgi:hypothetical protein